MLYFSLNRAEITVLTSFYEQQQMMHDTYYLFYTHGSSEILPLGAVTDEQETQDVVPSWTFHTLGVTMTGTAGRKRS